jgi:hypothetical protein
MILINCTCHVTWPVWKLYIKLIGDMLQDGESERRQLLEDVNTF